MKNKLMVLWGAVLGLAPVVALAQISISGSSCSVNVTNASTLFDVLCKIGQLLNAVVPVLIALGVLYFVWGVVTYVIASEEEAKKAGRNRMIFGIIGLAVILALWGFVAIIVKTFGATNTGNLQLPTVPIYQTPGN